MQKKKMFWISAVVIAAVFVILLLSVMTDRREENKKEAGISLGEAARALALAVADQEEIEDCAGKNGYMEYLILQGLLSIEPEEEITVADLEYFAEKEKLHPEGVSRRMEGEPGQVIVTREQFWIFYEKLVSQTARGIRQGTGIAAAEDGTYLYLKEECLYSEGYETTSSLDQKITYYKKGQTLIGITAREQVDVSYENVLVTGCDKDKVTLFLYGGFRDFQFPGSEKMYQDAVLDVRIQDRKVVEVDVKSEEIRAKVLSATEEYLELEGYGEIPFSDDFMMYKGYGNYAIQQKNDINVGYDIQKFFVAEGKICAGLTTQTLEAKHIRVMITTTGFASRFHESVSVTCEDDFIVSWAEQEKRYPAGQVVTFDLGSRELSEGRVTIRADRESFPLQVISVTRNSGVPEYVGTLELKKYDEGIVLLNEVLVEDYLLKVVPSEVPSSFHKEALNVQAITARTYACRAIEENACWEYGAHVDDSENFQVYANVPSNPETEAAVRDTYGQILKYGEEMAVIYYFSTSCGATTGPEIWGGSLSEVPYMEPKWIGTTSYELDLTKEEDVRAYLSKVDENAYEKECEWFRWTTELSLTQLTESVNSNLAVRRNVNPALILVKEGGRYVEKEIQTVGDIQTMEVVERGNGGTVESICITGSEAEVLVSGQTNIRTLLGSADCVYQNISGTSDTYRSLLQSSFFYLESMENGYRICGGGKGHGLGMPQNGMNQMALSGMSAESILQFFFDGTLLLSIY